MTLPAGFNFRNTGAYISDVSPDDYVTSGNDGGPDLYPKTYPNGLTAGWETLPGGVDGRNRTTTQGARLAGLQFSGTGSLVFRVDLPAAGQYNVQGAWGDQTYATTITAQILDNASNVKTIASASSTGAGNSFFDATGAIVTAAAWNGGTNGRGNVQALTFSSTILRVSMTTANQNAICHLYIEAAGVAPLVVERASLQIVGREVTLTPPAPQTLRPDADIVQGTWVPSTGSPFELWRMLDETSPDDSDYIYTDSNAECEVSLNAGTDPGTNEGHVMRVRLAGNDAATIVVTLKQGGSGGTTIATRTVTPAPSSPTTYEWPLTALEAAAITDYTNLAINIQASR